MPGSNFEIEDPDVGDGANLGVDGPAPALDWFVLITDGDVVPMDDLESGQGDNSFGQGAKEDSEIPAVVAGSIPPNKSDLKTFGVYLEENAAGKYMHLFWTRVQDPSGTTNMDFEFNQSSTLTANGHTPERTAGDLLIVYELSKGGTFPQLFLFTWLDGSELVPLECEASKSFPCWGNRTDLTTAGAAIGSINTAAIPAGETAGLGPLDARTFGEASIDLSVIFDPTKCQSFGSAYLKSRSSDSFTAALKDFILPQDVNITNCGKVIIRKQTDPDGDPTQFGFTTDLLTDPVLASDTFSLADDGVIEFEGALFGTDYTVTEDDPAATGFDLESINCDASSAGTTWAIDEVTREVTFDIVTASDVIDCTFTNRARGTIIVEKQTIPDGAAGTFEFTGHAAGTIADGGTITVDDLVPGTYTSTEVDPTPGFDLTSIVCDDGNSSGAGATATFNLEAGETVKCIFTNTQRGAIKITKKAKNANHGTGLHAQSGVTFTVLLGGLEVTSAVTDENGEACVDGLVPGAGYAVVETVPGGYAVASTNPQSVTVTAGATCTTGTPNPVYFENNPLSELEIIFRSLAGPGVTKVNSVTCTGPSATGLDLGPLADTESHTLTNLLEGTYVCTIVVDP